MVPSILLSVDCLPELLKCVQKMDNTSKVIADQHFEVVTHLEGQAELKETRPSPMNLSENLLTDGQEHSFHSVESLNTTYDENMDIGVDLTTHLNEIGMTSQSSRLMLES